MSIQFYVDKSSATLADSLTVHGLAVIVRQLLEGQTGRGNYIIRICDCGSCYGLDCDPLLDPETVRQFTGRIEPAALLLTIKNRAQLSMVDYANRVDYEKEKEQRNFFLESRQKTSKSDQKLLDSLPEPHPDWDIFRAINPAALPGYNTVLSDWAKTTDARSDVIMLLLNLFASHPNDLAGAEIAWKTLDKVHGWKIDTKASALQLYNPDQGKGQNRGKANALSMGNVESLWLLELLKLIGLYHAGITRTLRQVKDRKTYVLAPIDIDYEDSEKILSMFKKAMQVAQHPVTSDIVAVIQYVRAMLIYAESTRSFADSLFKVQKPRNVVGGFYTAFYKDLGNAVVTMNLSFTAFPQWITIRAAGEVAETQEILADVEKLTWSIDETHSDGYQLLSSLRDFVSGGKLAALFEFTTSYASFYMSQRERNRFVHQLTTQFIRSIVVNTDKKLSPIFEDEGFINIAFAIRQSTVTAQYRKMQNDRRYEIRYGLGQELSRKSRYANEFVTALSEFIQKYNAENVQVAERMKSMSRNEPGRRSVKTTDIEAVVRLIDAYGAPLIANLLIAYGYARLEKVSVPVDQDIPQPGSLELTSELDNNTDSEE